MIDRPDAARLLEAMAETLQSQVLPAVGGEAQHAVRVVANLCRILEREVRDGGSSAETSRRALARLLEREGSLPDLAAALDEHLSDPELDPAFVARARELLEADVRRRLAIDRPGYDE